MSKNVLPVLRFEGFSGVWKSNKLQSLAKFSKGSGYTKQDLVESGTPIILYGRLYTKYEAIISKVDTFVNLRENSILSEGDEVIVPSSGESAEDIARASFVEQSGIVLGGDLNIIKPSSDISSSFLSLAISNGNPKKELAKKAQGKSIVHLHNSDIKEVILTYPPFEEQQKIGSLFKQLDNTIALQQQLVEQQQQYKKAMLQKMFPQKGERVPKVRFDVFNGDWENYVLNDVAKYRRGSFPQPYGNKEWFDKVSGMPFVQVFDVKDNLKLADSTKQKISVLAQPKSVFVDNNTLLVTLQGSIGRVALTQYPSYVDRTILIFEEYKLPIDLYYFAYIIQELFEKEKEKAPGGTIKTITKEALSLFIVSIPSFEEQQKIGDFFKQLDDTIALHQKKLEDYQQLKKALLQRMFI